MSLPAVVVVFALEYGHSNCGEVNSWYSLFLLFIYSNVYSLLGPFLPHGPVPFLYPLSLSLPGRTCSALFSNFFEEKT
jgi:hypothetical protein